MARRFTSTPSNRANKPQTENRKATRCSAGLAQENASVSNSRQRVYRNLREPTLHPGRETESMPLIGLLNLGLQVSQSGLHPLNVFFVITSPNFPPPSAWQTVSRCIVTLIA